MTMGGSALSREFLIPPKVLSGIGALRDMKGCIGDRGQKALIVTDNSMAQRRNVGKVIAMLADAGLAYQVYDDIHDEPTEVMVEKGVQIFNEEQCDFILAVGGGCSIDAAKAIGFMAVNDGDIGRYRNKVIYAPIPFLIAVPTTAGTGSEATQFMFVNDRRNGVKMLLQGPALIPQLVVVDPELSTTAPPQATVAAGLDALTHAIEAYSSKQAQPLSDVFALSAIQRIYRNLKLVYEDGSNREARYQMSLAALEGGIAFNNSSATLVHGMSHPFGTLFHIPHGLSNAILLPKCLEFAVPGNVKRFADMARVLDLCEPDSDLQEAARLFVKAVHAFCRDLSIPAIQELNVNKEEFYKQLDKMAEEALDSGGPANTVRNTGKADIVEIYQQIWEVP